MRDKEFFARTLCLNFNGRNNLGRSELRQFYYHLQKGHRMIKEEKESITNPYV